MKDLVCNLAVGLFESLLRGIAIVLLALIMVLALPTFGRVMADTGPLKGMTTVINPSPSPGGVSLVDMLIITGTSQQQSVRPGRNLPLLL